jgi:hypothetical protein
MDRPLTVSPIGPAEPFGRALLAEARKPAAPAAPEKIVLTLADKKAGLGAQRAAEALAASLPLEIERERGALERTLAARAASARATVRASELRANPGAYREKLLKGEMIIVAG